MKRITRDDVSTLMMGIASGQVGHVEGEGGYAVRRPLATDAIGGALLRTYAHAATIPEDMRRSLDRLDRRVR